MSHTVSIEQIVQKTSDLPTIPAAAIKVMRETQSSKASAATVARILVTDQALSAKVLRLANSAFYGLSRKITDLGEAVVVLGMKSVKNLALVAGTYPWMQRPLTGYCLGPEEMWRHAFGTAVASQLVARATRKASEDVAFTAGLLHDLGKVALSVWLENKMGAILLYAGREGISYDEAERRVLGYDHCQVGYHLATNWNLPEEICTCNLYHHKPSNATEFQELVDCVHVGDYICSSMGYGLGGDGLLYRFDEESLVRLNIKPEDIEALTDEFVSQYEEYESLFKELAA
ncbi:MAG: HDOD domain-containing protein [Fimbriimonadaceae bacterium]|nr:MAG: HDOD domain-containing protein [Fimbriimonadaceae bacterium]